MIECQRCGNDAYDGAAIPTGRGQRRKYCPPCVVAVAQERRASDEVKAATRAYAARPETRARGRVYEQSPAGRAMRKVAAVRNWASVLVHAARQRTRVRGLEDHSCTISPEWVLAQFARQDERCFYSGVLMVPTDESRGLFQPSLDRRDISLGYTPENTVLVCWGINAAKGTASESTFREFLAAIRSAA